MSEIKENNIRDRTLSASSDRSEPDIEPHFEPIIRLPEVQVSTNEENESVLVKLRGRLYRFDSSNEDGPEWKERGTGEIKLLRHNQNNSVRIVMRRDKTFKVCANHFITPWMELKPSAGSDKAFVYTVAADFADEEPKAECLAIKFGNVEFANLFKEKFNEARNIVETKCSLYNSSQSDNEDEDEESDDTDLSQGSQVEEINTEEVTEKLSVLANTDEIAEKLLTELNNVDKLSEITKPKKVVEQFSELSNAMKITEELLELAINNQVVEKRSEVTELVDKVPENLSDVTKLPKKLSELSATNKVVEEVLKLTTTENLSEITDFKKVTEKLSELNPTNKIVEEVFQLSTADKVSEKLSELTVKSEEKTNDK